MRRGAVLQKFNQTNHHLRPPPLVSGAGGGVTAKPPLAVPTPCSPGLLVHSSQPAPLMHLARQQPAARLLSSLLPPGETWLGSWLLAAAWPMNRSWQLSASWPFEYINKP